MSEKNILAQTRPPLNQRLMTHSTRGFPVKIRHFKDDLRLRSHRKKFTIDILAKKKFRSQYTCGEDRKKFWDKKSTLNFHDRPIMQR